MDAPESGGETLPQKVLGLHRTFTERDIAFAFGGAIALAYHAEPRATDDIDVNILLPPERGPDVILALETIFPIYDRDDQVRTIASRDQTRVLWGQTPVDLFFTDTAFHESLATRVRSVDFGAIQIPIISAEDLIVCKALFNRPRDWVDIERVCTIQRDVLDTDYVEHWLGYFTGDELSALERFRRLIIW